MTRRLLAWVAAALVIISALISALPAGASANVDMGAQPSPTSQADVLTSQTQRQEREIADAAQTQLDALDISGLQSAADKLLGAAEFDVKTVLGDMRAGRGIDAESLVKRLIGVFAGLMRARMAFVIAIITCAAISGAATRLCGGGSGARISEMACLCVCAGMIVVDFTAYITQARGILELMGGVLDALLPLIAGLMAALGAKVAGGLLGGVAAAVAGAGLKFGREYLIGMALVSAALELCSGLYSRLKLARAAELMRSLSGLMVGAALVLVLGMITINGSLGVQVDEVGVRAAKYALDNMVPVVGGEIKDTVEVMAASCALVQSLLGTCGMLMLLLGVSTPALKLAAGYISYKICSSLTQTLGGGDQLGSMCEGFAKVLRTLLVCVLGAAAILIMLLGALGAAARNVTLAR